MSGLESERTALQRQLSTQAVAFEQQLAQATEDAIEAQQRGEVPRLQRRIDSLEVMQCTCTHMCLSDLLALCVHELVDCTQPFLLFLTMLPLWVL